MSWQRRFIGAAVLLAAGFVVAFLLEPGTLSRISGTHISACPFRNLTGLPCPGCGMTRAFHHLTHGHVAEALRYNPLSIILFGAAVVELVNSVVGAVRRGRPLFFWTRWLETRTGRILSYALVVLVFLFGGARIAWILATAGSAGDVLGGSVLWSLLQ
jgi:hypothetical protein